MTLNQVQGKGRSRVKVLGRVAYGIDEVAAQLGVCDNTILNAFHRGELKGYRVGRRILISADGFQEYLAQRRNITV
jgi:excisionase family DNA binding protein